MWAKHHLGRVLYGEPVIEKAEIFLKSKELHKPGAAVEIVARLTYLDYAGWLWQQQLNKTPMGQLTVTVHLYRGYLHHRKGCPRFANLSWFLGAVRAFITSKFPQGTSCQGGQVNIADPVHSFAAGSNAADRGSR